MEFGLRVNTNSGECAGKRAVTELLSVSIADTKTGTCPHSASVSPSVNICFFAGEEGNSYGSGQECFVVETTLLPVFSVPCYFELKTLISVTH